jgi:hypothetical protein
MALEELSHESDWNKKVFVAFEKRSQNLLKSNEILYAGLYLDPRINNNTKQLFFSSDIKRKAQVIRKIIYVDRLIIIMFHFFLELSFKCC